MSYVALSAVVVQLLSRLVRGIPPLDPVTFPGAPRVLGLVAFLVPVLARVARVDRVRALRAE